MNILMLTNIYPLKEDIKGFTPVVNYFCEEWVKQGHNVLVVNNTARLPDVFYHVPKVFADRIENFIGFSLPREANNIKVFDKFNGVFVLQLPYRKQYPGQIISPKKLQKQYNSILMVLNDLSFIPDVVMGHWVSPQLQLISLLKNRFKGIRTSLTIHSAPTSKELKVLKFGISSLDYIGFRNKTIKLKTEEMLGLARAKPFYCYSGVRDYFGKANEDFSYKEFSTSPVKIAFVGNLIKRKFPLSILEAANQINNIDFSVKIVGDGPELEKLKNYDTRKNIQLDLLGRLDRRGVYKVLDYSSIFIMISKNEAFGLVYLEAMLNRNIVIASRGDGFDGIIEDGVNGFLCEPGDYNELANILKRILVMSRSELVEIQKKSFLTATKMTDSKMAEMYLNTVIGRDE